MDKKYIGIEFGITPYVNSLARLFESVDVEKYTWYASCSENFLPGRNGGNFLEDGIYSGVQFKREIERDEYYIHLLCLYAVPSGKEFDTEAMKVYDDFLSSNAEIGFFSADSMVDLYVKDGDVLKSVYGSCVRNEGNFIDPDRWPLGLITKETNKRTELYT